MRISAGLSRRTGLGRIGVSRRGKIWAGARTGDDGAYLSVLDSGGASARTPRAEDATPAERLPAAFQVYPHGRITVTLGGQAVEVTRAELHAVLRAADATVKGPH